MTELDIPNFNASQYQIALADVLRRGVWEDAPQGVRALTAMQVTMAFTVRSGFPMITERSLERFWRKPIGELCAFINGVTRVEDLRDFGCDWWGKWTTEDKTGPKGLEVGDIGPGSYGAAFHDFPTPTANGFDQFANLMVQMRDRPLDRTHFVSPWIPYLQFRNTEFGRRTTVSPCHGWVHVRILNDEVNLHMFQRSGDLPIGVPSNMVQYGALTLMIAHLLGLAPGSYFHTISDAHVYENQLGAVEEMLSREPRTLPTVSLTAEGKDVQDIHDFRRHHFRLEGYDPHPSIRIPVAV